MINNTSLIITAHPDDETIFFAGLIISQPDTRWKVLCVTDGNADGHGAERFQQLSKACKSLGVSDTQCLNFPDHFETRLDIDALKEKLKMHSAHRVFTHGVLGEYGHPHHQDVCLAVHRAFHNKAPIYSVAYNCFPDLKISLNQDQWQKKSQLLSTIYFEETRRFVRFLPATWSEGFSLVSPEEVEAVYAYLASGKSLDENKLEKYAWFAPYFKSRSLDLRDRPF